MKVFYLPLSLSVLLLAGMAGAWADPPQGRGESRVRPERAPQDRMEPRPDDRPPQQGERKQQRLSPEERKALRQHINEAGQDLYQPKR